jgi:hypothetical protein
VPTGDEVVAEPDLRAIAVIKIDVAGAEQTRIQPESTPDLGLANYIAVPRDSQERFLKQFPTYRSTA